ncbi:MAG: DUF927 domain-containing protein, partial [Desulfurococcaceae archaeon]
RNNGFELAIDFHDNESYDIIEFYKKFKNLDFKRAIYELKKLAGIEKGKKKGKKSSVEEEFVEVGSFVLYGGDEPIGPRISILKAIVSDNISYVFYFKNESINEERVFQLESVSDLKEIEKKTGIIITKEQIYKKYINAKIANVKEKEILYKRTGWDEKLENFYHPMLTRNGNWEKWSFYSYFTNEKQFYDEDRHLEIIEKALIEAKALGFAYLFCFASAIAQKLKIQNLCLFIIGPSGIGKTTMAVLGTNLFYPSTVQFSSFTTQVGLELLMKSMSSLPILLDERAVNLRLDTEQLVFFVSSGKSKVRGTKTLSVNFSQLSNFIIFTSETDEEFKRLGAFRRFLKLSFLSREEITSLEEPFSNRLLWGGGVKVLRFFIENFDKFDFESVRQEALKFEELYHVAYAMFASLHVFEKFFNKKFDEMREYGYRVITEHYKHFKDQSNIIERFIQEFSNFVVRKYSNFIVVSLGEDGIIEETPRGEVFGKISLIDEKKRLFIISEVFHRFLRDTGFNKDIISLLEKHKIIEKDEDQDRYVVRVRLKGLRCYCYMFDIDKLNLDLTQAQAQSQAQAPIQAQGQSQAQAQAQAQGQGQEQEQEQELKTEQKIELDEFDLKVINEFW